MIKKCIVVTLRTAAMLLLVALAPSAFGQLVLPEITVDMSSLPEEANVKLAGIDSLLTIYIKGQEWAGDQYQYDFPIQISIFITEYHPDPQEDRYKGKMIVTNKQDVRLEDTRWEFGLRTPVSFTPGQYHPFKSAIEFYVWILVGMEYDRLEKLGGQPYYERARQIYLESSGSIYYFGWDRRIELLRQITSEFSQTKRELDFFYFTGIFFDQQQDFTHSKDYLYYALVKLDKVSSDTQKEFLEQNYRGFAEALVRAGYSKGIRALMQIDPPHFDFYRTQLPPDSAVNGQNKP